VTLVHKHPAALAAIERTQAYVAEELNVRTVRTALVFSVPDLVRFKCLPNHQLLGKRFGKEYKKVTEQIKALPHDELAAFMNSGQMTVGGNSFGAEDILVSLEYAGDTTKRDVEPTEGGLVLLDTKPDGDMLDEATAREVCAKVQKMRKEAGLRKTDEVDIFFAVDGAGEGAMLPKVLASQREYVANRIGRPMLPMAARPELAVAIASEKKEVRVQCLVEGAISATNENLTLTLCRACPHFDKKKLAKAITDPVVRQGAITLFHYKDVSSLRAQLSANAGVLQFTLDGVVVKLVHGEHFFLGSAEAAKAGVL